MPFILFLGEGLISKYRGTHKFQAPISRCSMDFSVNDIVGTYAQEVANKGKSLTTMLLFNIR